MNIVVNTRLLLHGRLEGIGWFTYENLRRIVVAHPEHNFFFLFDRPYSQEYIFSSNVTPVVIGPPARHPLLYYIWFEFSVTYMLNKLKADLFLSPDGYLSLRSKVPSIAVFHDLNFEHYPTDLPFAERWYYRNFFKRYAAKASRIATVSEFSKNDIQLQYGVDSSKIDVVFNGAGDHFKPVNEEIKRETLEKYTRGRPYFFFVGSIHPRKNMVNLFRAFDLFKQNHQSDHLLLLAGAKKWWTGEIASVYESMKHKDSVIFAGRLSEVEMNKVMGSADALTYVSYFEGFGIPIVEAFKCGTPVITSKCTSMPEVGGSAVVLTDPFKPEEIASAMYNVVNDINLRNRLIAEGFERSKIFTWEKSAERLWNCIEKVISKE